MSADGEAQVLQGLDFQPTCSFGGGACEVAPAWAAQMMCCQVVAAVLCEDHRDLVMLGIEGRYRRRKACVCAQCNAPRSPAEFIQFLPLAVHS